MRIGGLAVVVATLVGCSSSTELPGSEPLDATSAVDAAQPEVAPDGPAPEAAPNGLAVGDPCVDSSQCPTGGSGTTACLTSYPGGYCVVNDCAGHGHDCPSDPGLGGTPGASSSKCVTTSAGNACLRTCVSSKDCRAGYACVSQPDAAGHGSVSVCLPGSTGLDAGTPSD